MQSIAQHSKDTKITASITFSSLSLAYKIKHKNKITKVRLTITYSKLDL